MRDFFGPTKQRLKKIGENLGAFCVKKFVPRKKSFVPTSFCRRATLIKTPGVLRHRNLRTNHHIREVLGDADLLNYGVPDPLVSMLVPSDFWARGYIHLASLQALPSDTTSLRNNSLIAIFCHFGWIVHPQHLWERNALSRNYA